MTVKRGKSDANKWLPLTDGKILVHRLQDITFEEAASSPITSTHFHRDQSLVLVASDDKHLRLFRMNEENSQNKKVLNMQFNDLTIKNAKFIGSQHEELIVCGRRPFYYCYNLQSGQVTKIPSMSTSYLRLFVFLTRLVFSLLYRIIGNRNDKFRAYVCIS